ncbi:MAG: alginate export family protein [Pseudomonadales bacterium]
MRTRCLLVYLSMAVVMAIYPGAASANVFDTLAAATAEGSGSLGFRYRVEHVDQDGIDATATASTARARYTWTSGAVGAVRFGFEADYVALIGPERYNSTENGRVRYPVVADPEGFDLNQAFVKWAGDGVTVTGGRQRINHGGQRFVGGVAWRQNEQTFDGLRVEAALGGGSLDYAYVANVNRIFGPGDGAQPGDWRSDSHLLQARRPLGERLTVGAFGYLMDFDNDNGPVNANATYGIEAVLRLGSTTVSAALARQQDYADSPLDYRADYGWLEAAWAFDPVTVKLGYEVLGSDGGAAGFRTPLATLHKFQGWADVFLNTPADGVRDLYVEAAAKVGRLGLSAVYHDFSADRGRRDYGRELDVAVSYPLTGRIGLELKLASYRADGFATDTVKAWATINVQL